jgi:hypothetical protein
MSSEWRHSSSSCKSLCPRPRSSYIRSSETPIQTFRQYKSILPLRRTMRFARCILSPRKFPSFANNSNSVSNSQIYTTRKTSPKSYTVSTLSRTALQSLLIQLHSLLNRSSISHKRPCRSPRIHRRRTFKSSKGPRCSRNNTPKL